MSNALELEVVTLRAALAASQAETAEVRAQLKKLQADFDALLDLATKQSEQLAELRTMLRRKTTPQKPPAAAPSDPEGDTASATTEPSAAVADPDPAPVPKPWPKKAKTRPKGAGWLPKPDHLPHVEYRGNVCKCEHCGSSNLVDRDLYTATRIDAVETIARLRREILEVVKCKDCGKTTTAPPPSLPCERAKFTCGFLAWLVVMKFVLLVPLNRIHKLLRRQGVVVPKSTLVRLIALATDLASPIDNVHWRELKARKCVLTDGTGLKVQIEGLPKVWHAVLDVFNGDQTAVYKFALTKHGDEIAKLLTGFQGVIMCDAESRLNELCRQEGIKRANCNAHPRREFRDAEAAQPVLAKKAGDFISKMYSIERRATAEGLVGSDLLARRQAETRPIADAFRLWLEAQLVVTPPLLKSDPFGKVVRYYLRHFDDLTRFVDDADIPIDNNPSERAFQDHARLRLNSLFAGSPKGGRRWAVLLGVVTTAKRHELDIQAYLTWMFERRGTRRRDYKLDPVDLTPAAYMRMLEKQRADAAASREARGTEAA